MNRLSAFLIVKNEARDLPGCLKSLAGLADEIVVVDDGSTDETAEIARAAGAQVFSRMLDGFAAQKQFALDRTTGDWAFSIDADERVTPALAREIRAVIARPEAADGYELERQMYFLGKRLRHGGVGVDWVLRLFRRGRGRFRPVRVHERVDVEGTVARLTQPLEHYSYATLREYLAKCNHYTTLAAQDLYGRGRRFRRMEHLRPVWEIFQRIVLKGA